MTTTVIIDIAAALVLLGFAVGGAKRGLFRALAGLLTIVVALAGAGIIAAALTTPVTKLVTPLLAEHVEQRVENALAEESDQVQMPEADVDDGSDLLDLLSLIGLDSDVRENLVGDIQDAVHDTGVSVATAVVESLTRTFIYGALFLLSFAALLIVLKIAIRAMDLVLKLPVLHGLNAVGGAAIGLAEGALVLFLSVWVLRRLGMSFETGPAAQTVLFQFFTTHTPLDVLSLLQ